MIRGRGAPLVGWVAVLVLGACSYKATGGSSPSRPDAERERGGAYEAEMPEEAGAEAAAADEDPAALDARLDDAWRELRELDEEREKAGAADFSAAAARCDRIRGLADEICTLSDRMCTLATEHPGERRYAVVCARSQETCRSARRAAERCPAA